MKEVWVIQALCGDGKWITYFAADYKVGKDGIVILKRTCSRRLADGSVKRIPEVRISGMAYTASLEPAPEWYNKA